MKKITEESEDIKIAVKGQKTQIKNVLKEKKWKWS